MPEEGADRVPAAWAGGTAAADANGEFPLEGAVRATGAAAADDDADDMPPPPNLAAMRARASSRRRVCRIMYCSSDSPVKRSIPFRSSCGNPGASCNVEVWPEGAACIPEDIEDGAGAGIEDVGVSEYPVCPDPKPPYLLCAGLFEATSR